MSSVRYRGFRLYFDVRKPCNGDVSASRTLLTHRLFFMTDYAGWADKITGDMYPADDGFYKIVRHEPLGVCAGITAWNGSLHFLAWKAAPALACGNTVIIKPSEKSPLGTLAAGYLIKAAGFPPGVFQILTGGSEIGAHLSAHMGIQKISFTGSCSTGKKIQEAATKSNLKRVTLELGGKSPGIVFKDADLDTALFWSVLGITVNTGQVCAATSRLLVDESIDDDPVYREEVFGSVLCVKTFKTEEEAIGMGNDTDFGLTGSIYTENLKRALRTSGKLRAGTVAINCAAVVGPQVPMGGFGASGVGRELGEYALRHYTEPKSIWIK